MTAIRLLGIDPGSRYTGWGVITVDGKDLRYVAAGILALGEERPLPERLCRLHEELAQVIREQAPGEAALEAMFFARNARSAAVLGHARGVAMLALAQAGLSIVEYPPARVKSAVTSFGTAGKRQVALSVRLLLGMTETPTDDAADALAIALTHAQARLGPLGSASRARVESVATSRVRPRVPR